MKKNIIIVSHAMYIGGAERSLLGLLSSFNYDEYNVDLFLMRQEGELFCKIPKEVNLLPENTSKYLAIPIKYLFLDKKLNIIFSRLKAKIKAKKFMKSQSNAALSSVELDYSHKFTLKYIEDINPFIKYDLCISFLTPHYIAMEKVNAKKKIAWIHTDYSTVIVDDKSEIKIWEKFDKIVSISDDCTNSFLKVFPTLKNKIIRIDNILTYDMLISDSKYEIVDMDTDKLCFLSIGRFTYQKNFESIPEICKIIRSHDIDIKWYIIGFGMDEEKIKYNIKKYDMEEFVFILGKKDNPYPYINQCDVYLQLSRYEGKSIAVREAQMLQKPVIITDYPTSHDQVNNNVDGLIVPLKTNECALAIVDIIKTNKLEIIKKKLMIMNYDNDSEIEKKYQLID